MGRKKEEPQEELLPGTGLFPRNAVTPIGKSDDERLADDLDQAVLDSDKRDKRRARDDANSFDPATKQHVLGVLQAVIDSKAKFRSKGRRPNGSEVHAIVQTAMAGLNAGLPVKAKGDVQKFATEVMESVNEDYGAFREAARWFAIDLASEVNIEQEVDTESVADVVASIPRT
jgi:hypothetical protein